MNSRKWLHVGMSEPLEKAAGGTEVVILAGSAGPGLSEGGSTYFFCSPELVYFIINENVESLIFYFSL